MSELPKFPEFKKLREVTEQCVNEYTRNHPPHASFEYCNVVAWDIFDDRKVSDVNGNLLLLRSDYETREPYLCLLGNSQIKESLDVITKFQKEKGMTNELRFFPEDYLHELSHAQVEVHEDRDSFEYIYATSDIAELGGSKYRKKRQQARKFEDLYPQSKFVVTNAMDEKQRVHSIDMFRIWEQNKVENNKLCDSNYELLALHRLFGIAHLYPERLIVSSIYNNGDMIAFSIDEISSGQFAMAHFVKADVKYKGVYEYLNTKVAQYLHSKGVRFWNWQQDLGLEGLRMVKKGYHPVTFLKTYNIKILN